MLKKYFLTLLFISSLTLLNAQKKEAYQLYNAKGKKVSYQKMMKTALKADVILFGEYHNNPISHWLQFELTKDLYAQKPLVMGAEMFEADNQQALNQYLKGEIDTKGLDTLARLWKNFKTDYAPLVDFAKDNELPFIATNIPRRYAAMVHKNGGFEALDSLSAEEKSWIAPLPVPFDAELPQYREMLNMMGGHGSVDMVKAQAMKDATMAHFIVQNIAPGKIFIHFQGAFHSDFHQSIMWYLQQYDPNLNIVTITTVDQEDNTKLEDEHMGRADFIICVDEDMTKTY